VTPVNITFAAAAASDAFGALRRVRRDTYSPAPASPIFFLHLHADLTNIPATADKQYSVFAPVPTEHLFDNASDPTGRFSK
jgi:hypothetical protein